MSQLFAAATEVVSTLQESQAEFERNMKIITFLIGGAGWALWKASEDLWGFVRQAFAGTWLERRLLEGGWGSVIGLVLAGWLAAPTRREAFRGGGGFEYSSRPLGSWHSSQLAPTAVWIAAMSVGALVGASIWRRVRTN